MSSASDAAVRMQECASRPLSTRRVRVSAEEFPPGLVQELRDVALAAATGAAGTVQNYAGAVLAQLSTKSSPTDFVSEADRASEAFIARYVQEHRPDDALQGEEGTSLTGTSGVSWVADPLDGTTNFYFQVPAYSVSLAAKYRGRYVAGVVVDCCREETWSAALGQGAWCGDKRLQVASGRSQLSAALVATGFGYRRDHRALQGALLADIIGEIGDVRRFGSAALDLCWVAGGRYDAFYESGLNDWDAAAGSLICEEAGATVGSLLHGPLLAATPELFRPLAALIERGYRRAADPGTGTGTAAGPGQDAGTVD